MTGATWNFQLNQLPQVPAVLRPFFRTWLRRVSKRYLETLLISLLLIRKNDRAKGQINKECFNPIMIILVAVLVTAIIRICDSIVKELVHSFAPTFRPPDVGGDACPFFGCVLLFMASFWAAFSFLLQPGAMPKVSCSRRALLKLPVLAMLRRLRSRYGAKPCHDFVGRGALVEALDPGPPPGTGSTRKQRQFERVNICTSLAQSSEPAGSDMAIHMTDREDRLVRWLSQVPTIRVKSTKP